MAFSEERLNVGIRYGVAGGPEFNTGVTIVASGYEQRNQNWSEARGKWDLADDIYSKSELEYLTAFFRVRKGRYQGFRFKDWSDFTVDITSGVLVGLAAVSGSYQLQKSYTDGVETTYRNISKPIIGTVKMYYLGTLLTVTTDYIIDYTKGIVALSPISRVAIDANLFAATVIAATKATNCLITLNSHPFITGDYVYLANLGGMIELNDRTYQITVLNSNQFYLNVNSTTYTTYISGGYVTRLSIAQSNPVRVYKTAHGFANGATISLETVSGMVQVNNRTFTVTNAQTNYFDLAGIDGTSYTAYTGGAQIAVYKRAGGLSYSCEYDIPVRFDTDKFNATFDAYRDSDRESLFTISSLPLVELRV